MLLNRAIVYSQNGSPAQVLRVLSSQPLPPPRPGTLNIRFLLSPINPADVNVVEGVYPSKPTFDESLQAFVGGNEGLAEVTESAASGLSKGDWVAMTKQQVGTWASSRNVHPNDVLRLPKGISEVHAATMTVNPPTAYNMVNEFVTLNPGDWLVQNGANSAVGQAVIQIAAAQGLNTLNFVRNRDNLDALVTQLKDLGATHVYTYDDLEDKAFRKRFTNIRLGLNCVGGPETTRMAQLLGDNAQLVSYGAMSKQPLSLPTSLFIFKDLVSRGYWQSRWYNTHSVEEKEALMEKLAVLMRDGKFKEPEHEIVTIPPDESDDQATLRVQQLFSQMAQGRYGKKVLLRFV